MENKIAQNLILEASDCPNTAMPEKVAETLSTSLKDRFNKSLDGSIILLVGLAYKKNVDDLIDGIKGLPKADGVDEIFVPGEPEGRVYLDRSKNGIPLPGGTISKLKDVAGKLSIQVPSNM